MWMSLEDRRTLPKLRWLYSLWRAGVLRPSYHRTLFEELRSRGSHLVSAMAAAARLRPHAAGLVDDSGSYPYPVLLERTEALAAALAHQGIASGSNIALLCRNHHYFVETFCAASLLGADTLFLNTGLAARQIGQILQREQPGLIIFDSEFSELVAKTGFAGPRLIAWPETEGAAPTLDALIDAWRGRPVPAAGGPSHSVILTSGTTGAPKGARRSLGHSATPASTVLSILERLDLRVADRTLVVAPAFHAWALHQIAMGLVLASTLVLPRRVDPDQILTAIEAHAITTLVTVPVVLQRILALGPERIQRFRTRSLRTVGVSGSSLSGSLARAWMDAFGDNLYNFYGSTELGAITIATPRDLRSAPGTVGRPGSQTELRLLDPVGRPVPKGGMGEIHVRSRSIFSGYTDGESRKMRDGFMPSGDLGHFDAKGRLFVDGRADDMIISGGENLFPGEIEEVLLAHPDIADVAVIGTPDPDFGQRLKAFVVVHPGASLGSQAVTQHVREQVGGYKVPRDVVFVTEIPRNATGKLLRQQLAEQVTTEPAERKPEP